MKVNLDIQDCFIAPVNLLRITGKVYELKEGDELEITTNDALTVHYLKKILELSNIEFESKIEQNNGNFYIVITRKKRT